MPKNKNAIIRYKIINQLLTNGKSATKKEIADACQEKLGMSVSLRTVENDIYAMRYSEGLNYRAPIEYCHQKAGYIYADHDYSIDRIPVNDEDLNKLRFAASLLNQYGKVKAFKAFSGAIDKVIRLINYHKMQANNHTIDFIEFEKNPPTQGMEYIDQLIPIIRDKRVISIKHHSFWQDEVQMFTVHPYCLKEYKFRWYLVGYCEERDAIRIFGLERIRAIESLPLHTFTHRLFNPELYFESFIGVNVPEGEPERIVLRFKNNIGKYILTQPIHSSQKLLQNGGDTHDFEYLLSVNHEFIGIILGWGSNVEVMEPASFRERVKGILQKNLSAYAE